MQYFFDIGHPCQNKVSAVSAVSRDYIAGVGH